MSERGNAHVWFDRSIEENKRQIRTQRWRLGAGAVAILFILTGQSRCPRPPIPEPPPGADELAVAAGNTLIIVDPASGAIRKSVTRYVEVQDLANAPDGGRLAVGVCHGDRIVELETADYAETAVLMTPDGGCAWDFAYSPDGESLAATLPTRRGDPLGARFADLRVVGDDPTVETELGRSLPALAYRPDGAALVVAGSGGLHVLAVAEGYRKIRTVDQVDVRELAFTVDGSFLLVGLDSGLVVLDATRGYLKYHEDQLGEVRDLAVDASGKWIAVVRPTQVTVRPQSSGPRRDSPLHRARSDVRRFLDRRRAPGGGRQHGPTGPDLRAGPATGDPRWVVARTIATGSRVDAVAFRPDGAERIAVLFAHGYTMSVKETFDSKATTYAFADALAANPQLPIDAFFMVFPLGRPITQDAQDLKAMIDGRAPHPSVLAGPLAGLRLAPSYRVMPYSSSSTFRLASASSGDGGSVCGGAPRSNSRDRCQAGCAPGAGTEETTSSLARSRVGRSPLGTTSLVEQPADPLLELLEVAELVADRVIGQAVVVERVQTTEKYVLIDH